MRLLVLMTGKSREQWDVENVRRNPFLISFVSSSFSLPIVLRRATVDNLPLLPRQTNQ
jgi:hypothetical protein